MMRGALAACVAMLLSLVGEPLASADPISGSTLVFPFSIRVSTAVGPTAELMGRTIAVGETLTGQLVFSQAIGSSTAQGGEFLLPDARVQLNVPSGFTLTSTVSEPFRARTENNAPGSGLDNLQLSLFQGTAGVDFVSLVINWQDYSGVALASGAMPSSVAAFPRTEFDLNRFFGNRPSAIIVGDTPGTVPTPEPASLLLLGTGIAGLAAARRRHGRA